MNKIILLSALVLIGFSSCEVIVEEPMTVVHVDARDRFLGHFDVDEYSETFGTHTYYGMDIVPVHGDHISVILTNFYGAGIDVYADVEGNYIHIPYQQVGGFSIEGDGTISGNRLDISYSVVDHMSYHEITDFCHSVAWR